MARVANGVVNGVANGVVKAVAYRGLRMQDAGATCVEATWREKLAVKFKPA